LSYDLVVGEAKVENRRRQARRDGQCYCDNETNAMTLIKRRPTYFAAMLLSAVLSLLPGNGASQRKEESSAALIKFLTHQSDRPDREDVQIGLFSCGQVIADLATAKALADLGDSAISAIEKELDVIEQHGSQWRYGSRWLQLAYARIKGRAAYPRLRRMEGDPKASLHRRNLDDAIALSLGITSYVSDSRSLTRNFRCGRGPEPRDALDQFILAWARSDRPLLEATLGPNSKAALMALLRETSWEAMRAEIPGGETVGSVAVGYRFDIPGRWSEPEETLEQEREWGDAARLADQVEFGLGTFFKDSLGKDCGWHQVKFVKASAGADKEVLPYRVDNSDLTQLLRTIASCAGASE
jgi:hypothetical protein